MAFEDYFSDLSDEHRKILLDSYGDDWRDRWGIVSAGQRIQAEERQYLDTIGFSNDAMNDTVSSIIVSGNGIQQEEVPQVQPFEPEVMEAPQEIPDLFADTADYFEGVDEDDDTIITPTAATDFPDPLPTPDISASGEPPPDLPEPEVVPSQAERDDASTKIEVTPLQEKRGVDPENLTPTQQKVIDRRDALRNLAGIPTPQRTEDIGEVKTPSGDTPSPDDGTSPPPTAETQTEGQLPVEPSPQNKTDGLAGVDKDSPAVKVSGDSPRPPSDTPKSKDSKSKRLDFAMNGGKGHVPPFLASGYSINSDASIPENIDSFDEGSVSDYAEFAAEEFEDASVSLVSTLQRLAEIAMYLKGEADNINTILDRSFGG